MARMRISKEDQAFYSGILTALAVVALHDQETVFREIVDIVDEKELIWVAKKNAEMRWSGLSQYRYGRKES